MRDTDMTNLGGLPPYEPVAKTPTARPVILTLGRAANRHTEPDHEMCDAIRVDSTTEFPALYDTFIARVRRQYSGEETGVLSGRCHLKLEDGRFIRFKHTDTWDVCRDILLTQDKSELWFTFWTQEVTTQEATTQQANNTQTGTGTIHSILASFPSLKSFDDAEGPKSVKVAIKKYRPSVKLPGTYSSAIATSGGCVRITSTTSYRDVTADLLTQAGLNFGTTDLNTMESSVKSSLLLTPWSSDGQPVRVCEEKSWTACRRILLRDYDSSTEYTSPKLAFEFAVGGEMSDTEQPPPYAPLDVGTADRVIIIELRRYTIVAHLDGSAKFGEHLERHNDAVVIKATTSLVEISDVLQERAGRISNIDFECCNQHGLWLQGLLLYHGRRGVTIEHDDTWLASRQLLLQQREGSLIYFYGVKEAPNSPEEQSSSNTHAASLDTSCRGVVHTFTHGLGRLLRRRFMQQSPRKNKMVHDEETQAISHEQDEKTSTKTQQVVDFEYTEPVSATHTETTPLLADEDGDDRDSPAERSQSKHELVTNDVAPGEDSRESAEDRYWRTFAATFE
ncbi:hypothetical protein LTR56_024057 [Elasticomyces elasticus]|nr:hypothetical protein LTR56_024057 [Elasticomyces elasticus]KAK5758629.1 hypothetical protein LTS12_011333 [Elasticomyces elasticus]